MSDRAALLAAILAAPDDDAPRLVYADWLDEQGEGERAEFIRVQIELARFPHDWRLVSDLMRAEDACGVDAHFWLPPAVRHAPRGWLNGSSNGPHGGWLTTARGMDWGIEWRRGFVAWLTCPAAAWLAHADAILAEHPVREARLTTWPVYSWWNGKQWEDSTQAGDLFRPYERGECEENYRHRWPGITFTLPELITLTDAYGEQTVRYLVR